MAKFCLEAEEGPSSPKRKRKATEPEQEDVNKDTNEIEPIEGTGIISVTIDSDVLDCPICMEPLVPPVFQCENGHTVCSLCCVKLKNKCHYCYQPIGNSRCLAIEKVIESIKIPCQHARYGCKEAVNYAQKHAHEAICMHTPFTCPISDCNFCGSSQQLSLHFRAMHWSSMCFFRYNCPFPVPLDQNQRFVVLHGEDDLLFLLDNRIESLGNTVAVSFIGPSSPAGEFAYDLMIGKGRRNLTLQSFTKSVKNRNEACLTDFLLIPSDIYCCDGKLKLEVCIYRDKYK